MKSLLLGKGVRKVLYIFLLIGLWGAVYQTKLFSPILLPSPLEVVQTFFYELFSAHLITKTAYSLGTIIVGVLFSVVVAFALAFLCISNRYIREFMNTLIAILDPIPGIALLPIAILWIGIGTPAIIFVIVHSVLWPLLLSILVGFDSVPRIYKEFSTNIGVSKYQEMVEISVPASFPHILQGMKTGWSRAWRALVSAEMVFGATGIIGGLGWDIFMKRSFLDMRGMISTLIVIMLIGIVVEFIFSWIEKHTLVKWGITSGT